MSSWNPSYVVGHPTIDEQHQELFARADALLDAMREGRASQEVQTILDFLGSYVVEHFGTEERLMVAARYPAAAQHKALHEEFVRRYQENVEAYRAKGATSMVVLDLRDMLRGWLVSHVCSADVSMATFLRIGKVGEG
jgi:hemerythrin